MQTYHNQDALTVIAMQFLMMQHGDPNINEDYLTTEPDPNVTTISKFMSDFFHYAPKLMDVVWQRHGIVEGYPTTGYDFFFKTEEDLRTFEREARKTEFLIKDSRFGDDDNYDVHITEDKFHINCSADCLINQFIFDKKDRMHKTIMELSELIQHDVQFNAFYDTVNNDAFFLTGSANNGKLQDVKVRHETQRLTYAWQMPEYLCTLLFFFSVATNFEEFKQLDYTTWFND